MDALALLCTLHADGPTTLTRLRSADCTTLGRVIAEPPERLAAWMRSTVTSAARFQREARNLLQRVGPDEVVHGSVDQIEPEGVAVAVEVTAVVQTTRKASPLERVLTTWRERDEEDERRMFTEGQVDPRYSSAGHAAARSVDAIRAALPTPIAVPNARAIPVIPTAGVVGLDAPGATAIAIGAVDGIDAETSARLAQVGVSKLHSLASCDALAIARASGLSYSRVLRLRALAKRASGLATAQPTIASNTKLSPAERPIELEEPLVRFEDDYVLQPIAHAVDAGGPFA